MNHNPEACAAYTPIFSPVATSLIGLGIVAAVVMSIRWSTGNLRRRQIVQHIQREPVLTPSSRGLRTVRVGDACQPCACTGQLVPGMALLHVLYVSCVPTSGVLYVPRVRTVATQARAARLSDSLDELRGETAAHTNPGPNPYPGPSPSLTLTLIRRSCGTRCSCSCRV